MKNRFLAVLIAVVFLVSGCATSVGLEYMKPATVDMSECRSLDVKEVRYTGRSIYYPIVMLQDDFFPIYPRRFCYRDGSDIADRATGTLRNRIVATNYFSVGEFNADAVLSGEIDFLDISEQVFYEDTTSQQLVDGVMKPVLVKREFFLKQKLSVGFAYKVFKRESGTLIAADSLHDSTERTLCLMTRYFENGESQDVSHFISDHTWSMVDEIEEILSGFFDRICKDMVPGRAYCLVDLKPNKPKVDSLKDAYRLVSDGYYGDACDIFLAEYRESGHRSAGYNAAVLMMKLGRWDEAIQLMEESGNYEGARKLSQIRADDIRGRAQFDQIVDTP